MKILILGGAGYKGCVLLKSLLDKNYKVDVLDNKITVNSPMISFSTNNNFKFFKKDLRDITEADTKKYDVIFHLAGVSGFPACESNPTIAEETNVGGSKKLVNLLSPRQKLIYASTTYIYEYSKKKINEDSRVDPKTLYAKTKLLAENICLQRENSVSLRFATVFGISPKMRDDLLLNNFVKDAIQKRNIIIFDPHSLRSFVHIDDAIKAYLFALNKFSRMKQNIFNVGSEELNISKLKIAETIKKIHKFEIILSKFADLDKRNFIIDFSKIKKLGFKINKNSLNLGIKSLINLYKWNKLDQ